MDSVLNLWDLILAPFVIILILLVSQNIQNKRIRANSIYSYYTLGAGARIFGAISICLIYTLYYDGGDTVNYFLTGKIMTNLYERNPTVFFDVMRGHLTPENYSFFDEGTGYPNYWTDSNSFFVVRAITPICMILGRSYIAASILLGWICYEGMWRLYLVFTDQFPMLKRELAFAVLFAPSVIFWGSGILKDTITISAVGWFTYAVYRFFIQRNYNLIYLVFLFVSAYLMISIKPYILFALLPGSIVWMSYSRLAKITNRFIKYFAVPVFSVAALFLGFFLLTQLGQYLGTYSLDKVLNQAVIVQADMKQDYYGGNTFDIGTIDPTISGVLSKAHLAIAATLFRPYLWDVKNIVMLVSALENSLFLGLTIYLLVRLRLTGFFSTIGKNPLLVFSFLFSLFFAFSVGISISNFGSLVRLKIPCIPFYLSSLFILKYYYDIKSGKIKKTNQ